MSDCKELAHIHSTDYLANKIAAWGLARKITINSTPSAQAEKCQEEVVELIQHTAQLLYLKSVVEALNVSESVQVELFNQLLSKIKDDVGDIFVTLIMVCELLGLDHRECIQLAYEEIKDRKGELRADGKFYKE